MNSAQHTANAITQLGKLSASAKDAEKALIEIGKSLSQIGRAEMNNEDLDKLIIERKGLWFTIADCYEKESVLSHYGAMYSHLSIGGKVLEVQLHGIGKVTMDDFEQRAKELGFINGYRWGVEYKTNGERPELADDVKVCCLSMGDVWYEEDLMTEWNLGWIAKFKITDPRYKPEDTSYLDALSPGQSLTHKSDDLTHNEEGLTHSWFDYENQEALRLPPVGVECYRLSGLGWIETSIVAHHHDGVRAIFCDEGFSIGELGYNGAVNFKPLDHATRKAELEKRRVVDAAVKYLAGYAKIEDIANHLYDAGYLHLPTNKD
jgi:hypothetical protein